MSTICVPSYQTWWKLTKAVCKFNQIQSNGQGLFKSTSPSNRTHRAIRASAVVNNHSCISASSINYLYRMAPEAACVFPPICCERWIGEITAILYTHFSVNAHVGQHRSRCGMQNEADGIERAIRSCNVATHLNQPEIVVVDGRSTDDTVELAQRANARVLSCERGRGRQMNLGVSRIIVLRQYSGSPANPGNRVRMFREPEKNVR